MMERGYEVIHKLRLMMFLVRKGFNVCKVSDKIDEPNIKVFLFQKSNELTEAIHEYSQIKQVERGIQNEHNNVKNGNNGKIKYNK